MVWLPGGEKIEGILNCFDRMYERDRRTDTHTETDRRTPHSGIGRPCIASRGKKRRAPELM